MVRTSGMPSDSELAELVDFYETDSAAGAARWRALFATGDSGPVVVVNAFKVRDREAMMAYAATSVHALARVGGRFLASSAALTPLFGTPADANLVVVGWYPDRAALLALLRDPEYRAAFAHRRAALESQWVMAVPAVAGAS